MSLPYKDIRYRYQMRDAGDEGIEITKMKHLFNHIEDEYVEFLERYFKTELESNDFINISGASTLVGLIDNRESNFTKYDLDCELQNVQCLDIGPSNNLTLRFLNVNEYSSYEDLEDEVLAETIHSAKAEFLEGSFRIKKFSDYLYSQGLSDMVLENLAKLSSIQAASAHKYRLIKNDKGDYLLRGITSVAGYRNYNIPFSVCLALLALHRAYKDGNEKLAISSIYLDDSNLEVIIERSGERALGNVGSVKHHLVLSNDEIRRKSMSISGLTLIVYNSEGKKKEVHFQSKKELKSGILSISHGSKPDSWMDSLELLPELIKNNEESLFEDFRKLSKVGDADQLRFALQSAFKRASKEEIKKYKMKVESILKDQINSIHALLEILNKISLLAQADLEAREYMRYIFYTKVIDSNS